MGGYCGRFTMGVYCWRFSANDLIVVSLLWEVTMGTLLQEVYHGSSPWEVYCGILLQEV